MADISNEPNGEDFSVTIDVMEPEGQGETRRALSTDTLYTSNQQAAMNTALLLHEHGPTNQRVQVRSLRDNQLLLNLSARDEEVIAKVPNGEVKEK